MKVSWITFEGTLEEFLSVQHALPQGTVFSVATADTMHEEPELATSGGKAKSLPQLSNEDAGKVAIEFVKSLPDTLKTAFLTLVESEDVHLERGEWAKKLGYSDTQLNGTMTQLSARVGAAMVTVLGEDAVPQSHKGALYCLVEKGMRAGKTAFRVTAAARSALKEAGLL
ncbi:hypothetical protein [Azospirillum isscasi]|uniref:Uncharacterized protein n=1 Tax=Azospirillum isscasi TaxID=3053926 RepID=A0ABU0WDE5_9PROT|nr:hypothetical protein [Azospirillum isscasi]MDQ2102113.1 hypothetical protein [Azospirillum isscasi]